MKRIAAFSLLIVVFAAGVWSAQGGGAAAPVDFARDVLPILKKTCFDCHGPDKARGKLRLDTKEAAFKGGAGGPVIVPGKPDKSELLRRVLLPKGADDVMPARGEPLDKQQIAVLRRWIEQGAPWPAEVKTSAHWAYVKPVRPALPKVKNAAWPRTPLDYFILARLEKEGLQPSPEADRATLLRRVSLDLVGLPPAPEEVDAFVKDTAPDAYEKVVERLLQSPQFGERWARPWLDLARYADSHGFQKDDFRNSFAYRDWVIKALNADMPFDQFTIEQLAGDLLPNATLEQQIATGFHRCAPTNVEAGSEPEETRVNQVFDRVNTTAAVWLGTTLECAQCHEHKYDPFTQKDYYRLFAFFNNTAIEAERANPKVPGSIQFIGPYLTIPTSPGKAMISPPAVVSAKKLEKQLDARKQKLTADLPRWEKETLALVERGGQTHLLKIADFHSLAGSPHKELDDGSVLLTDDPPEKDTYVVTVHTNLRDITGFKLETLTHPSLPGQGPGRGDAERPNFVLNDFKVTAAPKGKAAVLVKLVQARADFSQKMYEVAKAIDGDPKTAWAIAPAFHKPHWAIFETDRPLGHADGTTLTFTLVQNFGKGRTIGRLRLSALVGKTPATPLPAEIVAILKKPAVERSTKESRALIDYRLEQDEEYQRLRGELGEATGKDKGTTTLVMQELSQPRVTAVFVRGDYKTPGEKITPGVPAVLHPLPDGPPNRLTLARWLVHPDNPLVARVTVNRWWAEIFGHGLVRTLEDFGIKGEPPTHPELLDWLAVEFVAPASVPRGTKTAAPNSSPLPPDAKGDAPKFSPLPPDAKGDAPKFSPLPPDAKGDAPKFSPLPPDAKGAAPKFSPLPPDAKGAAPKFSPLPLGGEGSGVRGSHAWSMKNILRHIVLSATYRQSSKLTPLLKEKDDQNRLYARGPRVRLDAETIRDNALAAAGLLSLKQFGPPIRPYQPEGLWNRIGGTRVEYVISPGEDRFRRGIYVVWKRSVPYPSFVNFDATARYTCTVKRSRSNTPLQALTLLNDPVYVEAALALAKRAVADTPKGSVDDRLRRAFRLCLVRAPHDAEVKILRQLFEAQRQASQNNPKAARELVGNFPVPAGITVEDFAAYYAVAAALLNLDETITRN